MYFYKMHHRGGFKEAAETVYRISGAEFLKALDSYRFYSSDGRLGESSIRFMYRGGPEKAWHDGAYTWLIMCTLPVSKWRF